MAINAVWRAEVLWMDRMCPLNGGGVCLPPLPCPPLPPLLRRPRPPPPLHGSHRSSHGARCSVRVSHGEDHDGEDEAVLGPEARDERAAEAGHGVPAEPELRRELHPERHLRGGAGPAPGGLAGGRGGWQVFHEGRHSADRPDRGCQRGQYGSNMSPPSV